MIHRTDGPYELISSAQDLTGSWANLGVPIPVNGFNSISLFLNLDINLSEDARVRLVAKLTEDSSDVYSLPIKTVSASAVSVEEEYFEFNVDADQKVVISWDLESVVPFVQFQVEAGTVGATAGQIDNASYVRGWK